MARANPAPETNEQEVEREEAKGTHYIQRVEAIQTERLRRIMTARGVVIAKPGDYIVSYGDKKQAVLTEAEFEAQFEREKGENHG